MGGLTSAVQWWEKSQLRVLVVSSMAIQILLLAFSSLRRLAIPRWARSITWLVYLAGDAVAIYALATLFNRHKQDQGGGDGRGGGGGGGTLEVMWAPVLLIHLGGQDSITAYNIEDNELWSRHLLTAVSQVTVAIYVFCKSWPRGYDKRLLQAAILLFIAGVLKCFMKPWALKSASIYSLVSSSPAAATQKQDQDLYPLQEYVKRAKEFVDQEYNEDSPTRPKEHGNNVVDDVATPAASMEDRNNHFPSQECRLCAQLLEPLRILLKQLDQWRQRNRKQLQELGKLVGDEIRTTWPASGEHHSSQSPSQEGEGCICAQVIEQVRKVMKENDQVRKHLRLLGEASYRLFVDLTSPYRLRLGILKYFLGISNERAYVHVQRGLTAAFHLLYTKLKTAGFTGFTAQTDLAKELKTVSDGLYHMVKLTCRAFIRHSCWVLPFVSISLFHQWSHNEEEAHNKHNNNDDDIDVKITYTIFCCTAILEFSSALPVMAGDVISSTAESSVSLFGKLWTEMVAQYSLIEYFGCKGMRRPCFSSATISRFVLEYLKDGWKKEIHDIPSYHRFNNHSRHWPVLNFLILSATTSSSSSNGRRLDLSSMGKKRPFDESVLLWHMATDLCFFTGSFAGHETTCAFAEVPAWKTRLSTPVFILLLGIPDLIHGGRKRIREIVGKWCSPPASNDRTTCCPPCCQELTQCKAVLCTHMSNYMAYLLFVNPEMLLPGSRSNLATAAYQELKGVFENSGEKPPLGLEKGELTREIIRKLKSSSSSQVQAAGSPRPPAAETFIQEALMLAEALQRLGDDKMWEVIQGVWVEMLCFSASRCRGYLHAKALGTGGELLSYVWLLLFYMGMETFTDKLQREEEPPSQEFQAIKNNSTAPPSTPNVSTTGMNTTPSTIEMCIIDVLTTDVGAAAPLTSKTCMAEDDMVNVSTTAGPSTSEMCIINDVFTTDAGAAPSTS